MLCPFLVSPPEILYPLPIPLLPNPPTQVSWPRHSSILGHRIFERPRASSNTDGQLGHPLLHIQLEPQVPPCVFFDWWFSSKELWGYWLVHIGVPSMGLQSLSCPWVFLWLLHWGPYALSNGWLWASTSVFARHWQSLTGDSYIRLLSAGSCQQAFVGLDSIPPRKN